MLQNTSTDTPKPGKSGFQVIRMIEWGKNDNPKKSLELPTNPKTAGPKTKLSKNFPSLKNLQKEVNDVTRKI